MKQEVAPQSISAVVGVGLTFDDGCRRMGMVKLAVGPSFFRSSCCVVVLSVVIMVVPGSPRHGCKSEVLISVVVTRLMSGFEDWDIGVTRFLSSDTGVSTARFFDTRASVARFLGTRVSDTGASITWFLGTRVLGTGVSITRFFGNG